jgi:S1-C subfamily serine protease
MRAAVFAIAVAACVPSARHSSTPLDEDLGAGAKQPEVAAPASDVPRAIAPPGPGARTGTVSRARMNAVLDAGVPALLRQLEVAPHLEGQRFVGWELVQLVDPHGVLTGLDVAPGDILLAVNGMPLSRPDELQAVWDSLRTENVVVAELWRGRARFEIRYEIKSELP